MAEKQVATLSVSFDIDNIGDNSGGNRIVLKQLTKYFDSLGRLLVASYGRNVSHVADVGSIIGGETRSGTMRESLKFSNSKEVTLQYPTAYNVAIRSGVLMAVTTDQYGNRVLGHANTSLTYDSKKTAVVADKEIYGACFVTYDVSYQIIYYLPKRESIVFGGMITSIGSMYAYNDYDVQVLDLELDMKSSPEWVEYARVTSKIVLDSKGVWEFPPNWQETQNANRGKVGEAREAFPSSGSFPGFDDVIDPDNNFVDTRVHCIIEVNSMGSLMNKDHNNGGSGYWAWNAPYFGDSSYNPVYEITFAAPPGGTKASSAEEFEYDLNHRTWRDVFLSVDKAKVISDLQNEYPGATVSGSQ